jgi:membrane protein DedA with SNARE-associated domain
VEFNALVMLCRLMISTINHLISSYGYFGVALIIGLESAGIPLPGETALISAALYAGTTHNINIFGVIAAAVAGAVIGDNLGYLIGRRFGLPILLRYGPHIGITEAKLKLGRYLFAHYGVAVVFFGRFVAVLRTLAAFLAGINQMAWPIFFGANLSGAVIWAGSFGTGAYLLGQEIHKIAGPIGIAALVVAVFAVIAGGLLLRRNEERLQAKAEAEFPGPIGR